MNPVYPLKISIVLRRPHLLLLVMITMLITSPCYASELEPFSSDGCSAFPDGTIEMKKLWLNCCTAHDYAYWQGGTYADRLEADKDLKTCVEQVGEPKIALLMLAGVRVGGTPFIPTTFRWGYGWSYPRFYGELTQNEKKLVLKTSQKKQ